MGDSRSRAAVGTVALLLTLLTAPLEAAAADWIELRSHDYELLVDQPEVIVPVPVKLAGVAPADVEIDLIQVRHGKRTDQRLRQAFRHPGALVADQGQGPILPITVDLKKIERPGFYELLFEARTPDPEEPVELRLTVEYPQPALASVGTHRIRRTLRFGNTPADTAGLKLRLTETTGKAWLTGLSLEPREFADETQVVVDVDTLALRDPPAIPPRETVHAQLELAGDFPLGTTNGTAVVAADQLSTPITVNFAIETRLTRWWIVWIILVGLLVGFLVRVVLQRQVELNEARLRGFELVEKIQNALQHHPDEEFESELGPKLSSLEAKLEATSVLTAIFFSSARAEELTKAVTEADGALQVALSDHEARRVRVQSRLNETAGVTNAGRLPGSIAAVLQAADQHVKAALASLSKGRVTEADGHLNAALRHLRTELREPVRRWRLNVDFKHRLDPARMPLPADVASGLADAIATFDPLLKGVPLPEDESSLAEIRSVLGAVRMAETNLSDLVVNLRRWLNDAYERTAHSLSALGDKLPKPQVVEHLKQEFAEIQLKLDEEFDQENRPEAVLEFLADFENLRLLDDRWRQAILSQDESEAVKNLVAERRYAEAAQQAATNVRRRQERTDDILSEPAEAVPPPVDASTAPVWVPRVVRDVEPARIEGWVIGEERPDRVRVSRQSSLLQLAVANGIRWLVAGLGIVIVGYLLFHETFVGTVDEMAGLFFWAFGLDVTVDVLWEQGKRLIPKS